MRHHSFGEVAKMVHTCCAGGGICEPRRVRCLPSGGLHEAHSDLRGCWWCWRLWVCSRDSPLRDAGSQNSPAFRPWRRLSQYHPLRLWPPTANWLSVGTCRRFGECDNPSELATTWSHWWEDPQSSRETRAGRYIARKRRLTQSGSRLGPAAILENSAWYQKQRLVDLLAAVSGHFLVSTHLHRWSMLTRLKSPKGRSLAVLKPGTPGLCFLLPVPALWMSGLAGWIWSDGRTISGSKFICKLSG